VPDCSINSSTTLCSCFRFTNLADGSCRSLFFFKNKKVAHFDPMMMMMLWLLFFYYYTTRFAKGKGFAFGTSSRKERHGCKPTHGGFRQLAILRDR
jgi:hypothetical protein